MTNGFRVVTCVALGLCLCFGFAALARTQSPGSTDTNKESKVNGHASGSFEINMVRQPLTEEEAKTMAAGVFRKMVRRAGFDALFTIDSAGTFEGYAGQPASMRAPAR